MRPIAMKIPPRHQKDSTLSTAPLACRIGRRAAPLPIQRKNYQNKCQQALWPATFSRELSWKLNYEVYVMTSKSGHARAAAFQSQDGHSSGDVESADTPTQVFERPGLYHAPRSPGWLIKDIDWKFVFASQHYGTIIWGVLIAVALAISHYVQEPNIRPYLNYDAAISYTNVDGDKVPASAAVLAPFGILIVNLIFYEFFVFRFQNKTITHALATFVHFLLDALCCFVTVVFITEVTKFSAGNLRPDFLQSCDPTGGLRGQPAELAFATSDGSPPCLKNNQDSRKSFPSGHASSSAVTMVYSIVYGIWAGYYRGHDASFMGVNRQTGWRGGRRLLRECGHGAYLVWNLAQVGFFWAVGVTRFTDNKHHLADIVGGWFLGTVIAAIYSLRAVAIHKYVALDGVA